MNKTQMLRMELANAHMLMNRYNSVDRLIKFWKSSGPNRCFPGPPPERVEGHWTDGLF